MGNDEATCYVGSLSGQVTEDILRELFIQVGPVVHLTLKKTETHSYALVEFDDEDSVPFALEIMDGVKLFNLPISVKPRNNTKQEEIWKKALASKKYGTPDSYQPRGDRGDQRSSDRDRRQYGQQQVVINMLAPPPPPPPLLGYPSPSVNRVQPGYKVGNAGRDNWHTPPNPNMLNPRIPPEFERSRNRDQSRGGGSWSAPRHDDHRNGGGWHNDDQRERRYDNRNDDRREERRSHGNHRDRYNQPGGSHHSTPRNYGGGRRY